MADKPLNLTPATFEPLDEADLSPAMRALNPRQREYVRWRVAGFNGHDSVIRAGYSASSRNVIDKKAWELNQHPGINAVIREETLKQTAGFGPQMIAVLASIAMDKEADDKARISAANSILDRGGFSAMHQTRVDVHHHQPSREEVRARLAAACDELGFTPEMKARALRVNAIELTKQSDGSFAEDAPAPTETMEPAQ